MYAFVLTNNSLDVKPDSTRYDAGNAMKDTFPFSQRCGNFLKTEEFTQNEVLPRIKFLFFFWFKSCLGLHIVNVVQRVALSVLRQHQQHLLSSSETEKNLHTII